MSKRAVRPSIGFPPDTDETGNNMKGTVTMTIDTKELHKAFELKTRDNGDTFYCLKDTTDKPEWLQDAIYTAHAGMLPDDYIYQWSYDAVCAFDDYNGDIDRVYGDLEGDIYNCALLKWLSSHPDRVDLVDETLEECGGGIGLINAIQIAQVREKERVFAVIFEAVKDAVDLDAEEYAEEHAEQFNGAGTVSTHWDCECAADYIHPKSQQVCLICNADKDEQPDSMADEVAKLQE